ncbi:MAG: tRNA (N(6)-L-threonylcarbamoyladenosine(37)-C(2))-methylthiotransferase MtaB [Anaerolineales bacterium]
MKVYLDTVGCRLNQSEIETYARQLTAAGHHLVATMEEADMMVLNTCAVTAPAASDSRQKIRQANRAGVEEIVVTGCLSTIKPEKIAAMPGVVRVVPNEDKDSLVANVLDIPLQQIISVDAIRLPVPGSRMRTRAFIKVQDGCANKCTFCITTVARGGGRSRPVHDVLDDVQAALDAGTQEVVLTGVHLGSWGYDFAEPQHLKDLVTALLENPDLPRLRLSSLEPWDLDEDFFALWQDPRLCRHLHLPLQSGSAGVLRRMARKVTPSSFSALLEAARKQIPDIAITTDLIAGFPGETDEEFEEGFKFVEEMDFAGAHVFTYSARQGTAAARMPNQVHNYTRKERNAALREVTDRSHQAYQQRFLGQMLDVLWESAHPTGEPGQWQLNGLTDNYLRVLALADQPRWNQITPTRMVASNQNPACLSGEISLTS